MSQTLTLDKFMDALDRRTKKHLNGLPTFEQGVVVGYDKSTNTAQVTIKDDPALLKAVVIGTYVPVPGDLVEVRVQKGYLVIHGATAGAGVVPIEQVVAQQISAGSAYWRTASATAAISANGSATYLIDTQIPFLQITADGVSYYRVQCLTRPQVSVAATTVDVAVVDGGNSNPTTASPIVAQGSIYLAGAGNTGSTQLVVAQDVLFTTGLHTLGVMFHTTGGTGVPQLQASVNEQKELTVFNPKGMLGPAGDIGPPGPTGPAGPSGPPGASYNTTIPTPAAGNTYVINHALNTTTPICQLWDTVSGNLLWGELTVTDANHLSVTFNVTPPHGVNVVVAAGTPGGGGTTLAQTTFQYSQATASAQWNITHNLGFYPSVSVVDSSGTQIFPGSVQYPDANHVNLTFSSAVGGYAYLS